MNFPRPAFPVSEAVEVERVEPRVPSCNRYVVMGYAPADGWHYLAGSQSLQRARAAARSSLKFRAADAVRIFHVHSL